MKVRRQDHGLGVTPGGGNGGSFAARIREQQGPPHPPRDGLFQAAEEFRYALYLLDAELESLHLPDPVRVNAVGGFAMLCHDLREGGYTVDIDTITPDYPAEVREAIARVADALSLERDWLNNEAAGDSPEIVSNMLDAVYLPQDFGFAHLDIRIADIPTLTRAKAIAVSDSALSARTRDFDDLLDLLDRQQITSQEEFAAAYPQVGEWEYPEVHAWLREFFQTGTKGTVAEEEDLDIDALLAEIDANGW